MINDPQHRAAIFEIVMKFAIQGHNVIFISHDSVSAAEWCRKFSKTLQSYGLLPKFLEKHGIIKYSKYRVDYNFPIPRKGPDFWTHPISCIGYWIRMAMGLIKKETYPISMRFISCNSPDEALNGYHGLVYYEDEFIEPIKGNKFWEILHVMNTDKLLWKND